MRVEDVGREIQAAAKQYATALDAASRTSLRARVLGLIEQLELTRCPDVFSRRLSAGDLRADPALRGSVLMHLDLVFRSSVSAAEVLFTADRGVARIAQHPALSEFPIGVVLALPTRGLVRERRELFDESCPALGNTDVITAFALATNPAKLGAAACLLEALKEDARSYDPSPRVVAFSPLTGLRARVISLVDDEETWRRDLRLHPELAGRGEALHEQLLDLLVRDTQPDFMPEPASSWLTAEARAFARSDAYAVGNFHRSMGASLVGVVNSGDPKDSDALWARAYFDYGTP